MVQLADQSPRSTALRAKHYNATVTNFDRIHDDLAIISVRPDGGPLCFEAGQYTVLGLGFWEPRISNVQQEKGADVDATRLVRRAYSITSPVLDDCGQLVRATDRDEVEFYIALVREAAKPPALTPRLFMLEPQDRIHLGRNCHGHYTLDRVKPDDTVVFMATGCGEAPHNAMIAELLSSGHRGDIVSAVCTRLQADLAYASKHRLLEQEFQNYHYLTLTTREPRNIDPSAPTYVGRKYLQQYFASGDLEKDAGLELHPDNTHVFLCGSPAMVGVPQHTHVDSERYPSPTGMVELLEKRGFQIDMPHVPGNVHFETYW